ncbi:MAG: hypothetical protein ACP6IS_02720 [Candidatus Asgardarchaeia archaeon]
MTSEEWLIEYEGFMEKNRLQQVIHNSNIPNISWIDERPWIYIDNIMRIVVPSTSVYPIIAEILNYFEEIEYDITVESDESIQEKFLHFRVTDAKAHIFQGTVSGTKFSNTLIDIAKNKLENKLANLRLESVSGDNLLVANSEGFIFIDGSKLTRDQIDDIVYLILDSHDKAKEYQFVRNKLKRNFQIVILHEKAPLIVKKV